MDLKERVSAELEKYRSLTEEERLRWHLTLAYNLTTWARDCYEVGGESLTDPVKARGYIELLHRVASYDYVHLEPAAGRDIDESYLEMVFMGMADLGVNTDWMAERLEQATSSERNWSNG